MLKRWNFLKTGFYEGINLVLVLDTQAKGDSVLSHQRVPVLLVGDPVPPSLLGKTLDVSPSFEGTQIILTD